MVSKRSLEKLESDKQICSFCAWNTHNTLTKHFKTNKCREQMCHSDIKHTGRLLHRQHYTGACKRMSVWKALKSSKPLLMSVGLSKKKKRHKSGRQMHVVEDNKRASQNIALHLVSTDTLLKNWIVSALQALPCNHLKSFRHWESFSVNGVCGIFFFFFKTEEQLVGRKRWEKWRNHARGFGLNTGKYYFLKLTISEIT